MGPCRMGHRDTGGLKASIAMRRASRSCSYKYPCTQWSHHLDMETMAGEMAEEVTKSAEHWFEMHRGLS